MLRPQPIGFFPFPAGLMLLPPAADSDTALQSLLRGALPAEYPVTWRPFGLALSGQREAALELLNDGSVLSAYNRFVLTGDPALLAMLETQAEFRALAQAVAFTLGIRDTTPSLQEADGELRGVLAMAAAARFLEAEDSSEAMAVLTEGIDASTAASPLLAAHLLDQRSQLQSEPALAMQDLREALRLAANCDLPGFVAHLHLSLGSRLHEAAQGKRAALEQAAKHYQQALLSGYGIDQNPEMFAWTQQQLALAYLAMPLQAASDQLRMAIAVQSLREALKVYTKEAHLELWTTVQLNLANALQYLPSAHPKENLIAAVEIYEELLPFRDRAFDPVGYARLLFNQANALAHLGIFQPALEKLNESHKLFHWHGEEQLAVNALDQAARINEMMVAPV